MDLGNVIKKLRKKRKISQQDFAEKCKITQPYLSLLETNKKHPSLNTINKISEVLNIPIPILYWLSTSVEDIPEHKHDAFKALKPAIDETILSLLR